MLENPMDVLAQFPVRKSGKQKQAFRDAVQSYVSELGYESKVEKGSLGSRNVVIGDPVKAKYLVTAHYDTPARLPFPNLITPCSFIPFVLYQLFTVVYMLAFVFVVGLIVSLVTNDEDLAFIAGYIALWVFLILMMVGPANKSNVNDNSSGVITVLEIARALPEEQREQVCFVLFDLEEVGLVGSASYRNTHKKESTKQLVLNLDCVGDGNEILLFPGAKVRKDEKWMQRLRRCVCNVGDKSIAVREKGFSYYPSDQANFPLGVGIAALRRSKWAGLYVGRIHTDKDTILEETNVIILRDCLIQLIGSDAA